MKVSKKLKNQKGQGLLEYVMLLAVVAALVLAFRTTITGKITELTNKVGTQADQVIGGGG